MEREGNEAEEAIEAAVRAIEKAKYLTAFTGAGISVESGVPSFRGKEGLWNRYDPAVLDIDYFSDHPEECWPVIREIFYDHFGAAQPNPAHRLLARLEREGRLRALITQNIDDLHHKAGNEAVIEYHGNSRELVCTRCARHYEAKEVDLSRLPPRCDCGAILKPDFVFFGEGIPPHAAVEAEKAAARTDVMIVVGTTGEVYPAAGLPRAASLRGAIIIEINPEPSLYSEEITDILIPLPAGSAMLAIDERLRAP